MALMGITAASLLSGLSTASASDCEVNLSTSLYINWVAIDASQDAGLYRDVEREHDCKLVLNHQPDYLNSLAAFTSGTSDAVTVTNLDQMLALAGRDSTTVVIQDYSNGNDGVLIRNGSSLSDIKGQKVYMVRASISEQLFIKAAEAENLNPFKDFNLVHVDSDALLLSGYTAGKYDNIVTWNPALEVAQASEGTIVSTSADFPEMIVDMIALSTDVPNFEKKATFLQAVWDKTASVLESRRGDNYESLILSLTNKAGASVGEVRTMLKGSKIFTPDEEVEFYNGNFAASQADTYSLAVDAGMFEEMNAPTPRYEVNGQKGGDNSAPVTVRFDIK